MLFAGRGKMKPGMKWTDDCQGKKDYDGPVVSISTRYWPRGGGFSILRAGEWEHNDARPEIRPSAKAELVVDGEGGWESLVLAEYEVEADSEAEVKVEIERWVQKQYDQVVAALKQLYGVKES